jgi:cytochrome P450
MKVLAKRDDIVQFNRHPAVRATDGVHLSHRYVTEDFELNGWSFSEGETVGVVWSAANVDADAFEDPLTVDIRRKRNAHIDFATGPHRCLGSNLARMELVTALNRFHVRIPECSITPGREVEYINFGVRMAHRLPVSFPIEPAFIRLLI